MQAGDPPVYIFLIFNYESLARYTLRYRIFIIRV